MPYCQKEQRGHVRHGFIAHELQPLEHMPKKQNEKKTYQTKSFVSSLDHKSGLRQSEISNASTITVWWQALTQLEAEVA